ncbi:MAG: site-2 protease family protein [Campylobacterales bacterium]|nr:site-2 protease family protein [Campylobacterales bacterium]
MDFSNVNFLEIGLMIPALMVGIIGHEIMHGWTAYKYGDDTAKHQGRLTINPLVHVDTMGTVILPGLLLITGAPFLFGWAKPVPVNSNTVLRNGGYWGMVVVSLAGIIYNLALAFLATFLIHSGNDSGIIGYFLLQLVIYNVVLAIFNLMPIPPLDGANALGYFSRIIGAHSIGDFLEKYHKYGFFLLILIIATPLSQPLFSLIQSIILGLLT